MDVDLIFKIAAVGILVAVLNLLLVRSGREEQAMMTTLAGLVVVLMMLVQQISDLFQTVFCATTCSSWSRRCLGYKRWRLYGRSWRWDCWAPCWPLC